MKSMSLVDRLGVLAVGRYLGPRASRAECLFRSQFQFFGANFNNNGEIFSMLVKKHIQYISKSVVRKGGHGLLLAHQSRTNYSENKLDQI